METAYLKIKFTPLFENLQQDTAARCLEIIPEITHVENFDKIKYKEEKSYTEYTVPVTYRIILRNNELKDNEDLNRTYYSCVDFLPQPADEQFESCNTKRILSDTFLLTSVPIETERTRTLEPPIRHGKETDNNHQNRVEVKTEINTTISIKLPVIKGFDSKDEINVAKIIKEKLVVDSLNQTIVVDEPNIKNTNKTRSTKITLPYINEAKSEYINIESISHFLTNGSKTDGKYNLCMSPICTINTNDKNVIINADPILNQPPDTLKTFIDTNNINDSVYRTSLNDYFYYDIVNILSGPSKSMELQPQDNIIRRRILPDVRVAKIVKQMEREMTPLKNILGDILYKCSSLGFTKKNLQQSFLLNTEKLSKDYKYTLKKTKPNRVVYSIVFDS